VAPACQRLGGRDHLEPYDVIGLSGGELRVIRDQEGGFGIAAVRINPRVSMLADSARRDTWS